MGSAPRLLYKWQQTAALHIQISTTFSKEIPDNIQDGKPTGTSAGAFVAISSPGAVHRKARKALSDCSMHYNYRVNVVCCV